MRGLGGRLRGAYGLCFVWAGLRVFVYIQGSGVSDTNGMRGISDVRSVNGASDIVGIGGIGGISNISHAFYFFCAATAHYDA